MRKFRLAIILLWSIVSLAYCVPRRRKNDTTKSFISRTGEAIALDSLLHKYEKEHRKFYEEETRDGDYLEWFDLNHKNLSCYCRNYLQHAIPTKKSTEDAIGVKMRKLLHYKKENTHVTSRIVLVQCIVIFKKLRLRYYITRTPEPNCVYSLRCVRNMKEFILTIIHKYCDFENNSLVNRSLKWKREEIVNKVHCLTGQPIAKDEYLLKYEMEHQELFKREEEKGEYIGWPRTMTKNSLHSYCYQYMKECAPNRNREGVIGTWKIQKLHYQKLNTSDNINVTTIICQPLNAVKRNYYMTRAPETNCVYALIRKGRKCPLEIAFKHCNFEETIDPQTVSLDIGNPNKNVILDTKMKKERIDTVETLKLFPHH